VLEQVALGPLGPDGAPGAAGLLDDADPQPRLAGAVGDGQPGNAGAEDNDIEGILLQGGAFLSKGFES